MHTSQKVCGTLVARKGAALVNLLHVHVYQAYTEDQLSPLSPSEQSATNADTDSCDEVKILKKALLLLHSSFGTSSTSLRASLFHKTSITLIVRMCTMKFHIHGISCICCLTHTQTEWLTGVNIMWESLETVICITKIFGPSSTLLTLYTLIMLNAATPFICILKILFSV